MPNFEYVAINPAGARDTGAIAAPSEAVALAELEARKLSPITVRLKKERSRLRAGLPARRLAMNYTQLADLIRVGVPILRSLKLLGAKTSRPREAEVFRELADRVAEGEELAVAMERRPEVFPAIHVAMVRAGEKGGFLEQVLARLGTFVEQQAEMRAKIVGNLFYPAILVVFGGLILLGVFWFFVPMFRPLFESLDRIPPITTFVFALSDAFGAYGPVTIAVAALLAIAWWRLRKHEDVRRALAIARTRAPIVGPITRSLAAARFCRMLGTLLANGVPMLQAMKIAKQAAGNLLMEDAIDAATEAVRQGDRLAVPLGDSGLFETEIVEMISVAEDANTLDQVLVTIAETIERRVDRLLSTAIKLIEPAMLLAIAGVVAVVAIALILPMTQLQAG